MRPPPPEWLRSYAFVGDGERGVVMGPDGDVVWMSFPRWHDAPLFDSVLGGSGFYQVCPRGTFVTGGRYEEGTLIWRNRFVVSGGAIVEAREALVVPSVADRAVLLRRLEHRLGDAVDMVVSLRPSELRDRTRGDVHVEGGVLHMRAGAAWIRLSGASLRVVRADPAGVEASVRVAEQGSHDLVLELSSVPLPDRPPDPSVLWQQTEAEWRRRVPELPALVARRDARHAVAVLSGLTAQSGAMVAAATSSLPERADAGRNYDYRYAWIRDQSYAGQAAAASGVDSLLDGWVGFVRDRLLADGVRLRAVYRVDGCTVEEQREVALPGYPGGERVYFGNRAHDQFQLDCFGEALLLFAAAGDRGRLGSLEWNAVEVAAQGVEERWQEPDFGLWETEPRHWTHSKLVCAAGLARAARHAPPAQAHRWHDLSARILTETARASLHSSGRWQRAPDDERIDAALLLPQLRGLVASDDSRSETTRRAVIEELTADGHVYRFPRRDRSDAEGAFLLCNFWLAMAELQAGDPVGSARRFERARSACGPAGLFAEEYDVQQRQLRGNLPQAFVHAALLETASRQSEHG